VQDFVKRQPPTVQIGVVAFSDSGFAAQAPTNDQAAIMAAINRLTPTRGTSLAFGIQSSLNTISALNTDGPHQYSLLTPTPAPSPTPMPKGQYVPAVIILLTDGENNENPDPLAAAQMAADRGVRIYTVGIGSPAGTTIHVNGFTLHTQLNEPLLQQISQMTDGAYYNAQTQQDLNQVYDNLNPQLVFTPQKTELTSPLAGLSILLLLIGGTISLLWFGRLP
jgi:Ca-activated chloride channel family protein